MNLATLTRAALTTLSIWAELSTTLEQRARERLPIAAFIRGQRFPGFWSGPCLVHELQEAANGFPSHRQWRSAGPKAVEAASTAMSEGNKVQRAALTAFNTHLFPSSLARGFTARLLHLFPNPARAIGRIPWDEVRRCLLMCPTSWGNSFCKTCAGAWTTDSRFQKDRHSCVFGCEGPDRQSHYFQCRQMDSLLRKALNMLSSPTALSTVSAFCPPPLSVSAI
eukprot:9474157-Pyramimonas_sp.AAC.2